MQPQLVDALARDLAAAGHTGEGIRALLGDAADAALARSVAAPARRAALRSPGPSSTLLRALVLGDTVPTDELADALPALGVEGAVALGLVEVAGDRALPAAVIRPYAFQDALGAGEWWIASDLDELAGRSPLRDDHVLGVGGAARTLAALLPPAAAPVADALDLGTGCGVIALHLRRFADRVVATDVSERALRFAELNARLNGVDGIETRLGSLFEPVEGERFDLIASNPPFVITPRAPGVPAFEYRDGGRTGDGLMAEVVRGLGDHLRRGGQARLLGNWETIGGEGGLARVDGWERSGLDLWAIEREELDPVRYAELWLRDGGTLPRDPAFAPLAGAWLDDFEARGVRAIGMGWLAARRGGAGALRRFERVPQRVALEHVGAHLARALDDAAWLAETDDEELGLARLVVAPDVTEARHQLPGASGPNVIELVQGGGLERTLSVDTALAALVGACDGELPLGVLIGAIAALLEVDEAVLAADLLPRVRELVVTGFLARL
ncbi:class I SAM-dependent methyltransferase [Agrococcus sp. HG114]|uniref:class I SAM-dependent methyltransferase n=1 Tax=Agrococcus sp. HG114 TaxID=2969757 RepID=UPI00215A61CD|nr:class I SAM-dependent methyltransferase [Agrococcus sp. HG114]MCR8671355.1 class I SAM-dependent methyltransferase [Agrococcus sp. HG114]